MRDSILPFVAMIVLEHTNCSPYTKYMTTSVVCLRFNDLEAVSLAHPVKAVFGASVKPAEKTGEVFFSILKNYASYSGIFFPDARGHLS